MSFTYPNSDLDRPGTLLSLLGSFWSTEYAGSPLVLDLIAAKCSLERQTATDLQELIDASGRETVPVHHTDRWYYLKLDELAKNPDGLTLHKFDGTIVFDEATRHAFGVATSFQYHAWKLPDGLVSVAAVCNRITSPSRVLVSDIDFYIESGHIVFRDDPFDDPFIPTANVFDSGEHVSRECGLWLLDAKFDHKTISRQYGFPVGLGDLPSSSSLRNLVNAVLDTVVHGTTALHLRRAWSALTDVAITKHPIEIVEKISQDSRWGTLVITDREVYTFDIAATVTVAVGDKLVQGSTMTDALTFFDFNRGQTPTVADLKALALGNGFLTAGFVADLVFENKNVPLVAELDEDGFTKVSFALGGWPNDVTAFFDEMHARGRDAGYTLANLLDVRPRASRMYEPEVASLPATINPVAFLCQNVLRDNAFCVRLRPATFGPQAIGMAAAKVLRRIVPPQTAMLIVTELEHADDPIRMDGPGTETTPGYAEACYTFIGLSEAETLDGSAMISESVRCYQIGGRCI